MSGIFVEAEERGATRNRQALCAQGGHISSTWYTWTAVKRDAYTLQDSANGHSVHVCCQAMVCNGLQCKEWNTSDVFAQLAASRQTQCREGQVLRISSGSNQVVLSMAGPSRGPS
ncbi:predicted protein [Histoplasma capsulatum G186AR]|uniref:Uncharacterized protein n=1 Tax=Ajellomyces capsulatus (strain G186AR / H82 / ATCC MYA-2454 / RMSCC 2432) TaxID=447093 RepID=C0NVX6_AJECG|nr:uncharacterized protein HCBG_07306 [Histoplasma capsulatum G186AR]EEH04665.1 predicted protein [Histoplasma capsulatum G186AR]